MPLEVILPRVDMDMTTGKISKWYVKEGDAVTKGAPIFEIETDKAAMEVESPGDGIIRNISAGEGVVVPVGEAVAYLYADHEAALTSAPPQAKSAKHPDNLTAVAIAAPGQIGNEIGAFETPDMAGKFRATPLARSLARSSGITLNSIIGSGPRGRVVATDVRNLVEKAKPIAEARPFPQPPRAAPDDAILALYEQGSYEVIPIGNMRRTIAQRLVQSKQVIPHFYLTVSCDVSRLVETRETINSKSPRLDGAPMWRLSLNDFIIKAMALALHDVPDANVTWTESGLLRHRSSDIAVAVAVEGGLFTPVIRSAETKSLSTISKEMKDLSARARAGKLLPPEYQGGTTTISNLGMFGIEQFTAVINPPQSTILAVGAALERPIVRNGEIAIGQVMALTLSCDHRAVDGAVGARLLSQLRGFIEEPSLMLA